MSLGLRIKLSVMMFLQYFVWGIVAARCSASRSGTNGVNLDAREIGWVFTVYGFGAILGPFVIGQLADRYFATEKVMAVCHLVGGLLLIVTAYATGFWPIFGLLFLYCNLYMPTMGLSNSITFRNLGEAQPGQVPRHPALGDDRLDRRGPLLRLLPPAGRATPPSSPLFNLVGKPGFRDCLRVAGVVSILYGFYCFRCRTRRPSPPRRPTRSTRSRPCSRAWS